MPVAIGVVMGLLTIILLILLKFSRDIDGLVGKQAARHIMTLDKITEVSCRADNINHGVNSLISAKKTVDVSVLIFGKTPKKRGKPDEGTVDFAWGTVVHLHSENCRSFQFGIQPDVPILPGAVIVVWNAYLNDVRIGVNSQSVWNGSAPACITTDTCEPSMRLSFDLTLDPLQPSIHPR